jgi:hypothetical protein
MLAANSSNSNHALVRTLDDGHDCALLDSGWTFETVGVDATKKLGLEVHRVEGVGSLIVVGLDLAYFVFC